MVLYIELRRCYKGGNGMPVSEFANDSSFRLAVGEVLDHILEQVDELDFDEFDAYLSPKKKS